MNASAEMGRIKCKNVLDLEDFAKYMLVNYFCGNTDWDRHNWYASFNRRSRGAKWHFHSWDAEHVLKGENDDATSRNNGGKPTGFHHRLMNSPEYKLIFSDLVRREFFNGGELTPSRTTAHYRRRIDIIDRAIRAESARWGDAKNFEVDGRSWRTRDLDWAPAVDRLMSAWVPHRRAVVIGQLEAAGLW